MTIPRLKTHVWVQALIRRCDRETRPAVVRRKGDADAGAVVLKLDRFAAGAVVLAQARTALGEPAWTRVTGPEPVPEAAAEDAIARQRRFDPDVWLIEIEDPKGDFSPDEPVL